MANEFRGLEETRGDVQCRRALGKGVGQVVPPRRVTGHGRSDDRGQQRQDGVGHFHQTLASSQHHDVVPVSGHVSSGQICQEHLEKRPLHRGVQESPGSIGGAQRRLAGVSGQVEDGVGRVSSRDVASVWVPRPGSSPGQQRRSQARESFVKRGRVRAHVSVGLRMLTRSARRFAIFHTLCEDLVQQRCEDWFDRVAMTRVLQCSDYRQVWHEIVFYYNETYFREEIQSLWDTAGHLARRHELSSSDARPTRVHCLSTTL